MHSMDLPRGLLDRWLSQRSEPVAESDTRDRPWVPDGRARPPAELLDNLRLRLSQLADNHPSAARGRHTQRDWRESHDWREPRDWGEPRDWRAPRDWGEPRDSRAPSHWDRPNDWDDPGEPHWRPEQEAFPGEGEAAERDIVSAADQQADADDSQAGRPGGLADAIRAASQLSDVFPASPGPGIFGEMTWSGSLGDTEPYSPWFMGGDPWTPWWAADSGG